MFLVRSLGARIVLGAAALGGVAGAVGMAIVYLALLRDLPDYHSLADYRPALTTRVLDRHGRPIGEFYEQRRQLVRVEDLPEHVVLAFVASEDDTFFEHSGLDYAAILRAAWVDLLAGEKKQGASTITMQTAKNLLLSPERRFRRKLKEMLLARRIETRFTKEEILYVYLNEIYFGSGAYGVAEAARTYFDKAVGDLDVSEAALLAGLPKAPSKNSPFVDPESAEERRRYVLRRMRDAGFVDAEAFEAAMGERPVLSHPASYQDFALAGYFVEEVRRALFDALGGDSVLRGGLTVHTTLDLDLQRRATHAVRAGLEALDHRQGYRGHLRRVDPDSLQEEILRLAEENRLSPVAYGAEGTAVAEDEAGAPAEAPPPVPSDRPLLGVVTDLDGESQVAWVAFAPGVSAAVELETVSWAHEPDPRRASPPLRSIDQAFQVGDVAWFVRVPVDAEPGEARAEDARVTLYQPPLVEGALVSLEVESGDVLALVGGYDFERSEFDRATQARRQPGSAFKPIIYATALTKGYTGASIVHDRPMIYTDDSSGFTWRPENYGRRFLGPLTLREALSRSVNNATIHLLREVGVDSVIELAGKLGIESPLERNLSLGLGTSPISLLELTRAYAVFPRGGERVVPRFIRVVEDPEGHTLVTDLPLAVTDRTVSDPSDGAEEAGAGDATGVEVATLEPEEGLEAEARALSQTDAYLGVELMRAVVEDPGGTGRRARALGRAVAGKTGTTNDQGDAWFVGFSPDITTGVWVGFDEKRVLGRGETGGRAALPIWIDFMQPAVAGRPPRDFPMPEGIVVVRIDRGTGLLADSTSTDSFFQAFVEGTEPTQTASAALSSAEGRRRLRLEF